MLALGKASQTEETKPSFGLSTFPERLIEDDAFSNKGEKLVPLFLQSSSLIRKLNIGLGSGSVPGGMRQTWFITSLLKAVTLWGARNHHTELCSQAKPTVNPKPNAGENERNHHKQINSSWSIRTTSHLNWFKYWCITRKGCWIWDLWTHQQICLFCIALPIVIPLDMDQIKFRNNKNRKVVQQQVFSEFMYGP